MKIDFAELGRGPMIAHQVWVANMEMTKGNFCTQESLHLLCTPIAYLSSRNVYQHLLQMVLLQMILLQSTIIHPSLHQFLSPAMLDCPWLHTWSITPTITFWHILTTAHCPPPPHNVNAHRWAKHPVNFVLYFILQLLLNHMIRSLLTWIASTSIRRPLLSPDLAWSDSILLWLYKE